MTRFKEARGASHSNSCRGETRYLDLVRRPAFKIVEFVAVGRRIHYYTC